MKILRQREMFAYRLAYSFSEDEWAKHRAYVQQKLDELRAAGQETHKTHGITHRQNGEDVIRWAPHRRRVQNQMLHELYDQWIDSVPAEGKAMMMGGLPGSGKGYAQDPAHAPVYQGREMPLDTRNYFKLDPDEIKKEMALRGMIPQVEGLSPMEASALAHEEASDLAKRLAERLYRERRNVLWDITMSNDKGVGDRLKRMRTPMFGQAPYDQIDGVFMDAELPQAFQNTVGRHRHGEESFREGGQNKIGGRPVPDKVIKHLAPTPGSGQRSRNGEIFENWKPQFTNTMRLNPAGQGQSPVVAEMGGPRWNPNFEISPDAPAPQPQQPAQPALQQVARRRRMAAGTTVRELIEQFQDGAIMFPQLVAALAQVSLTPKAEAAHWGEVYERAEEHPDDNSFFWVEAAEFNDVLTEDQVEQIAEAIERYQS